MLSENSLELVVDDVLDVFCAIGISLGAGSWRIGVVVFNFFVEEELKGRKGFGCCIWSRQSLQAVVNKPVASMSS